MSVIRCLDDTNESRLCAFGYWNDLSVGLRTLPDFKEVVRVKTLGDMLARSLLLAKMENNIYLLSALGDGTLQYYQIDMQTGFFFINQKGNEYGSVSPEY